MRAHFVAHDGANGKCGGKILRAWIWVAFFAVPGNATVQKFGEST
jgi:hypothetical protein